MSNAAQSPADFEARLRHIGAELYHDKHPFHIRLHSGGCSMDQVRAWVINRYYYQSRIPMKDAAFMSRISDPKLRRIGANGWKITMAVMKMKAALPAG